jgi:hypothetical protein
MMDCVAGTKSGSKPRILPECATELDPNENTAGVENLNKDAISEVWLVQPVLFIWRDKTFAVRLCNDVTRGPVLIIN